MAWMIYPHSGPPKGSYGSLASAKAAAQKIANEQGGSAMVTYATRKGGSGGRKSHHVYPSKKANPTRALKSNRLTPVAFTVKGKRHTGKAKLVGGKVKVFVTANVARKMNPKVKRFYFYELGTGSYGTNRLIAEYTASTEVIAKKYFAKSFPSVYRRGNYTITLVKH